MIFASALRHSLLLVLTVAAPILAAVFATGLVIALLEGVTHLRESSLSSIPKLVVAVLVLGATGAWMGGQLQSWMHDALVAAVAR